LNHDAISRHIQHVPHASPIKYCICISSAYSRREVSAFQPSHGSLMPTHEVLAKNAPEVSKLPIENLRLSTKLIKVLNIQLQNVTVCVQRRFASTATPVALPPNCFPSPAIFTSLLQLRCRRSSHSLQTTPLRSSHNFFFFF
jgi:hypothetical protein